MTKFVGRKRELAELNCILSQRGAQFILVYGRRRVGKTDAARQEVQTVDALLVDLDTLDKELSGA